MTKNKGKSLNKAPTKRTMIYKQDMEEYAQIIRMLGDRRVTVMFPNKEEFIAMIPGRFRKRCWMKVGDVVVVSRRDFQDSKMDILHKYTDDEVKILSKEYEIPPFFLDTVTDPTSLENVVAFEAEEEEDIDVNDI
jgi:translation initiation factor 1A